MFKDIKFYSYLSITCRVKSDKFSEISDQTQIRNYFAELCRDRVLDINIITKKDAEMRLFLYRNKVVIKVFLLNH